MEAARRGGSERGRAVRSPALRAPRFWLWLWSSLAAVAGCSRRGAPTGGEPDAPSMHLALTIDGKPHTYVRGFVLGAAPPAGRGDPRVLLSESASATCASVQTPDRAQASFAIHPGPQRSFFADTAVDVVATGTGSDLGTGTGRVTLERVSVGARRVRGTVRFLGTPAGKPVGAFASKTGAWIGEGELELEVCGDPWSTARELPAPSAEPLRITRDGKTTTPAAAVALLWRGELTRVAFLDAPKDCKDAAALLTHRDPSELATLGNLRAAAASPGVLLPASAEIAGPSGFAASDDSQTGWVRLDAALLAPGGEVRGAAAGEDGVGAFAGTFVATTCRVP